MARKNQGIDTDDLPDAPTPLEVMDDHERSGEFTFRDHTLDKDDPRRNSEEAVAQVPVVGRLAIAGAQIQGTQVPKVKSNA